jgi:DNA-directed RNA polymerase specialized sigma24 family protein
VNQYIKARASVGELIEKHVSVEDPSGSWDPFSESSLLDGKLDVLEAKTEFVSITTSESAAVALYQAGLTYKEISTNTGLPTKKIRQVVQKQGIQRTRKKSVKVL